MPLCDCRVVFFLFINEMKATRLLCLISPCVLVSCGHVWTKTEGYAESPSVKLNGAEVSSAFYPNGGSGGLSLSAMVYMAGAVKLEGPFLWRVQATGENGKHQAMKVHRIHVVTEKTKRSEWFPTSYLNDWHEFKEYTKTPDEVYAYFQLPGELKVMPQEDGVVSLSVDVSIKTKSTTSRKLIKFKLEPSETSETEFIFIPSEVSKSFNPDPRDWKISVSNDEWFENY